MDIVACLLAPWSSGKDPDRYNEAPEYRASAVSCLYPESSFVPSNLKVATHVRMLTTEY
jgi:hypothetical protein